jgi:hypothetical protein
MTRACSIAADSPPGGAKCRTSPAHCVEQAAVDLAPAPAFPFAEVDLHQPRIDPRLRMQGFGEAQGRDARGWRRLA